MAASTIPDMERSAGDMENAAPPEAGAGTLAEGAAAHEAGAGALAEGAAAHEAGAGALAEAAAAVGDRWTLLVVAALLDGPRRFGELQQEVQGIAPNILTQRLRALERDGLLVARPYSERPARFVYELTAAGRDLSPVLRMLTGWGARHSGAPTPRHAVCGTPMEARWWCPTCEQPVADEEGEELHFA